MTASTQSGSNEFRSGITPAAIQTFEARLRPYLQSRLKGARFVNALPASQLPREGDFLVLAAVWFKLDPSFLALYQAAVSPNPQGYDSCLSPGGHYVIYYTTNPDSADAVDPTDTIGFGPDSSNWRTKTSGPNGIPDYIDQVAWALDSAWSMEVNGFGFHQPVSMSTDGSVSPRYHFFATETDTGVYGQTFPDAPIPGSPIGFFAHCEVRGNWTGAVWDIGGSDSTLNYNIHPENAARVTCVHENFHGIQYAMFWNNVPLGSFDYFPLGWIEGTAVLMEHLGFDYIKDYLQYASAFFSSPTAMSFCVDDDEYFLYSNSLLTIFLHDKSAPTPRIDFIKTMFYNNYNYVNNNDLGIPFDTNLRATSGTFNTTWVGLLNRFFTGSYFTGIRADTSRFDLDAALMPWWTASPDSSARSYSIIKPVNNYGMQIFDYQSDTGSFDTLTVNLAFSNSAATVPNPLWAVSCIVLGPGLPDSVFTLPIDTNGHSSVFTLPIDINGHSSAMITGWHSRNEILVIPTNGDPVSIGYAAVSFKASVPLVPAPPILSQPANGANVLGTPIILSWNTSTRAASYAVQVSSTSGFTSFAINQTNLTTLSSVMTGLAINTTYYWRANATNVSGTSPWSSVWTFGVIPPAAPTLSQPANGANGLGTSVTFSWNTSVGATSYAVQITTSSDFASIAVNQTGLTVLSSVVTGLAPNATYYWRVNADNATETSAWSSVWTFTTTTFVSLMIYPNPPHLSGANNFIRFEGTGIQSVRIYSLDGNLVTNSGTSRSGTFITKQAKWVQWQLKNNQGRSIAPGYYRAVVEQQDTLVGINSTTVHKLLVFP